MANGARAWIGKPMRGLTVGELEELAERLSTGPTADEPMMMAIRQELSSRRD